MFKKKNQRFLLVLALSIFSIGLGWLITGPSNAKPSINELAIGTVLQHPREIAPFSLTGIDYQAFDNQSLKGQWTFVFFGFTHCGSICPVTLAELNKMHQIISKESNLPEPNVVMITLDPTRDDFKHLTHYVKTFNPAFKGARGTEEEIAHMTHELGIAFEKILANKGLEKSQEYDIEHTGTVMLFNPQGQLAAFFTQPKGEDLAHDYKLMVA